MIPSPPSPQSPPRPLSIAVVLADFNPRIAETMLEAARAEILDAEARLALSAVIRVPGCYETPAVVDRLLAKPTQGAVVVLGYIERGETLHGQVMGAVVHAKLVDLAIAHKKPVGLGIIGPGATLEQAEKRTIGHARAAVRAVLRSLEAFEQIDE
ncbi:MAG TPA: 6,7-dimethyl-8-ribityllumazine synthase [Polyangiaceae bacterium]|nr:6,7-dimethyl-8-ribityllumazine synthase [Polyangiaceae bacterium]